VRVRAASPLKAFGYVRISKLDADTTSPQRQRQAVKRFCEGQGWELVRTFEDLDLSAYKRGVRRPGLEAMLGRLGEADRVVFWRLDRLARSVVEFARIRETCEKAGVELVSTDQQIDTSSAMGRAMQSIVATFAELESGVLSERSRAMHAYLREQGRWLGGRVPFGWRRSDDGGIEPVPEEQETLAEAARRYVAGESLRSVSANLGFYHPNLARMLRSDRVIEALPPAVAGPLVEALAERGRTGTRAKRSLLGGIARCGVCGAGMTVVGSGKRARGSYLCRAQGHASISRSWLDDHVSGQVLSAIDTGELLKRLDKRRRPRRSLASSELEARLEILERDHYERGMVSRDSYLRRREGILRRLKEARDAEQDDGIDIPRELAANLAQVWPTLSLMGRRRIIAAVLERIEVEKAKSHGRIDPDRVRLLWRGSS
jgi:DNA invertase Pin-like site-specific DNA recombinase